MRPQDLPFARNDELRVRATRGQGEDFPRGRPESEAYMTALRHAELFHVSAQMTAIVKAASTSLPDEVADGEVVLAPFGLAWFEEPAFEIPSATTSKGFDLGPQAVCGVLWGDGVMWWLVDNRALVARGAALGREVAPDPSPFACMPGEPIHALLDWMDEAAWRPRSKILRSMWLLMGQPLTLASEADFTRAERRRLARHGVSEPPLVRVVTLRRRYVGSGGTGPGREYRHQWLVRGHWRNQFLPSTKDHRPTWIAPHVKGPEDKPFIGGEKVYALKR